MSSHQVPPRNRAERRLAARTGKKGRAAGAALTAGSAALAMSAAWVGGMPAAGAATTLHVTTTANSGAGSLRDQVTAAASGDTIAFDVIGTITLTSGEIAFNKDLIFTGPGAGALAISGNDASRIFNVTGGAAVTISGLSFVHGLSSDGGAISTDGPLTLHDDAFDSNESTDDGGAVLSENSFTVTNSTFTNNVSDDWGGAVLTTNDGAPVSVTGSTFSGNDAGGGGGGLAVENQGAATVSSSTFDGNSTGERGGGLLFLDDTSTSVTGSTFTGNHATDDVGGGIAAYETGPVSITASTVSGNSASDEGGGVHLYEIDGLASISGTTISGNQADSGGGGVYAAFTYGGLDISNSVISGNTSDSWGGGLYAGYTYQFVNVTNTTIAGNTAAQGGGGVQLWGAHIEQSVNVIDSTISGNHANESGGGGWIQWGVAGPTLFANSTISGNTAAGEGGGLYFYGFYGLNVEMSTVTGNTSAQTTGGIFLYAEEEVASAGNGGHHDRSAVATSGARGSDDTVPQDKVHDGAADKVHAAATLADVEVTGSIVWGNSGNDIGEEANVTFSHSLLGTIAAGIAQTDAGGNLLGVNPELGPLQNNGGPTETHALLPGSPAIDTGPDPVPDFPGNEFDQRGEGFTRVVGPHSDIGAFEVQPPAPDAVVITPKFTG